MGKAFSLVQKKHDILKPPVLNITSFAKLK
jgi:hypothetical protein